MCNRLASRHVRVGLADPSNVPRCDICENAPAFFYCEIDGSSLCLQCDTIVHVGGKRTHGRYLLLRQRIEFPGDKPDHLDEPASQPVYPSDAPRQPNLPTRNKQKNHRISSVPMLDNNNNEGDGKMENNLIDLNVRPQWIHGHGDNNQEHGLEILSGSNHESMSVHAVVSFQKEPEN